MMRGNHKLLLLGGKPIGSCEIVAEAQKKGFYVVVADYLSEEESPAKQIADESWNLSTDDIVGLKARALDAGIEGVLAGVHEFNLQKMAELSKELGLPCYCTKEQQLLCEDKSAFKELCSAHGLNVAREYEPGDESLQELSTYPLVVKPRDGSGSSGFSKCFSPEELDSAISYAASYSSCGQALIEEYIESDAMIAQYTAHDGELYFCGLADKYSKPVDDGAPIMALQVAPSIHTGEYLEKVDSFMKEMLGALGVVEGPIWIELFYHEGRFVVNEIGYRFGGSLTYHLVKELCGVDQLALLIDHAVGNECNVDHDHVAYDGSYVIWPFHLKPGTIASIEGLKWLSSQDEFVAFAQVHHAGERIESWGSAKQVFGYLHLKSHDLFNLLCFMKEVQQRLKVKDCDGNDMLFSLFDPCIDEEYPDFVDEVLENERAGQESSCIQ